MVEFYRLNGEIDVIDAADGPEPDVDEVSPFIILLTVFSSFVRSSMVRSRFESIMRLSIMSTRAFLANFLTSAALSTE